MLDFIPFYNFRVLKNEKKKIIFTDCYEYSGHRYLFYTVIYSKHGTTSTAADVMLMVLEDYTTDLIISQFDVVWYPDFH